MANKTYKVNFPRKCPLCGAPTYVTLFPDSHGWQDISFSIMILCSNFKTGQCSYSYANKICGGKFDSAESYDVEITPQSGMKANNEK